MAKGMQKGVNKLHFWGERDKPMTPSESARKKPIFGTGKMPPDLLRLTSRSLYVATSGETKPTMEVQNIERRNGHSVWRIEIPDSSGQEITQLLGKSAARDDPEKIRAAIDPTVDFTSHCPDWLDRFYIPRTLPRTPGMLRRFNGRRVQPAYVFGQDDRQVYQDASFPWCLIGKVFNNEGKVGSGAIVGGPGFVLTAGHMVPWGTISSGASWWMRFVPDYFDGHSLLGAGVESYVSAVHGYSTDHVVGYDWAVCKLYNPVGSSVGWFGYNGFSNDWENQNVWTVAGYPLAVANGERPSWQGGISIHDTDGDSNDGEELESNVADITNGNSGGPIWGVWNGDQRVVGVVSGEESEYQILQGHEDNNVFASGSGLGNLIAWAQTNWE
jgi:V8-like Glu-specific endopeptidase